MYVEIHRVVVKRHGIRESHISDFRICAQGIGETLPRTRRQILGVNDNNTVLSKAEADIAGKRDLGKNHQHRGPETYGHRELQLDECRTKQC